MILNVIIPSYRSKETIVRTIESVRANRDFYKGDFDITVVDSSDDDTAEVVKRQGSDVNLVRLTERAYPGAARNRGMESTKGDVICFVDADAYADSNWLREIHEYLDKNPDVDAVGGPVLNANPKEGFSRLAHWCEFSGYGLHAPEGERRVQPAVNVAIRRGAFEKYGPFLENQFGNEDVLLFHRMKQAGAKLHFVRSIVVHHRNKTKLKDIYRHQRHLGECTGRARVLNNLPGSFLTRPGGSFLIPFIKTHFICVRLLTQDVPEFPWFMLHWWRVFRAMVEFARGFGEGAAQARREKS